MGRNPRGPPHPRRSHEADAPGGGQPPAAGLEQPRTGSTAATVTGFGGTARSLPCLGHWEFAADGPLSWLAGKQPLASFRVRDFDLTFG